MENNYFLRPDNMEQVFKQKCEEYFFIADF